MRRRAEATEGALLKKASRVKFVLLDVDGVLTDGSIIYGAFDGEDFEIKAFHVQDGFGISRALKAGLAVGVITGRRSRVVERRARELGIRDIYQGSDNKLPAYEKIKREHGLVDERIAYMGDDILDLVLLKRVGFSGAPVDARREVKRSVDYVSESKGGRGAVRDFIDLILRAQKKI
jgi:3-deoxy-D-manno-octulosonate 8-phosphate phosphatase (KDO 8-P phosphatase)